MTNDMEDTQAHPASSENEGNTQPSRATSARQGGGAAPQGAAQERRARRERGRFSFLRQARTQFVLILGFAFLLVTIVGGAIGWSSGRSDLGATATIEAGFYMFEQYNLALADMEAENYTLARERLEFIFLADPNFLDVADKWIEVALILGQSEAPTEVVLDTPSPTPTEDPRPKEELLVAASAHIAARDWTSAIDTLLALRKADPNYHSAEVDGTLYLALRNRGVQNITEFGLFEPGLYDFSLAENFGPLDGQAVNYQEWARLYLYGNAFWYAYPQEAAYYYGQLVGLAPDLRDSSGLSAFYRYWQSLLHYADQLAVAEDWCPASQQYQLAQNARSDASIQPTADYVLERCTVLTPSATFTPTITGTATATWTLSVSETATLTGSETATSDGSSTATATATASETIAAPEETATYTATATATPPEAETPAE